ncbi:hypothetical protein [Streptosporangium roseum]|uniref:hypothetical protein n=1 Tax=Streptosporangium roseum TaxID=2001 RepID=UPI00332C73DE
MRYTCWTESWDARALAEGPTVGGAVGGTVTLAPSVEASFAWEDGPAVLPPSGAEGAGVALTSGAGAEGAGVLLPTGAGTEGAGVLLPSGGEGAGVLLPSGAGAEGVGVDGGGTIVSQPVSEGWGVGFATRAWGSVWSLVASQSPAPAKIDKIAPDRMSFRQSNAASRSGCQSGD